MRRDTPSDGGRSARRAESARWPTLAMAGLAVLVACGEEPGPPPEVARPVKVITVPDAGASAIYEFPGQISAILNAEPAFEVAGKIVEYPVDEGQPIEEGDVIARLDPRDFESAVAKARASAEKSKTDVERYSILFEKGVNPKADLDRATRAYEVFTADLTIAEKALEDSVLRAPFDGIVAKKLVADYQNVVAKEPIIILQNTSTLQIEVAVPEADFASMEPGLTLAERNRRSNPRVSLNNFPGRVFPAEIKEFATTADPVTRTFSATFTFDPPDDLSIRPGMTAKVTLGGREGDAPRKDLTIPARAVVQVDGEASVWLVDPRSMTVHRRAVQVGPMQGEDIVIRSGLSGGEEIAVSGVHQLRDGMTIRRFGG